MICSRAVLHCADNSGASMLRCIGIPGGTGKKTAKVGQVIVVSVISVSSKKSASGAVKIAKGSVHRALIVRTKKKIVRKDGAVLSFNSNAAVLLNKQGDPIGRRVFGPVAREVRVCQKLFSIAKEVF